MTITARKLETSADLDALTAIVAALEGCTTDQAQGFIDALRVALGQTFESSLVFAMLEPEIVGALALRPTPIGALELFGGVPDGANRNGISRTLLLGARAAAPAATLSTFASARYWDVSALEPLGFKAVAQYRRLQASAPHLEPVILPNGFTISSYAQLPDLEGLVAGLRCYEDLWGHHHVDPAQVASSVTDYDPHLIWLARDALGGVAGVCRATLNDNAAWIDAPGVRSDSRDLGLHRAFLSHALQALSARAATRFTLESWGESDANNADNLELGFEILESEAMVAWDA